MRQNIIMAVPRKSNLHSVGIHSVGIFRLMEGEGM